MPYQAIHLAALSVYFETLGISDIGQLTKKGGVVPANDLELIASSISLDGTIHCGRVGWPTCGSPTLLTLY
jgi:hypothetical protein